MPQLVRGREAHRGRRPICPSDPAPLNDRPHRGNPGFVRERTQLKTLVPAALQKSVALVAALGLGLLAAGCGARSRTPLSERQPGTTTILVANHLGAQDELDHLLVSVDSTMVPLSALPPRHEEAAV